MTAEFQLLPRLDARDAATPRTNLLRGHDSAFDPDAFSAAFSAARAFPATGGRRITEAELLYFREECVLTVAEATRQESGGAGIDLALGRQLISFGANSRGEMGVASVWDFLTLILLPDLAMQRIGAVNDERTHTSVRSRLTGGDRRHVLQRLWKRRFVFGEQIVDSRRLTEDDYVATLERRVTLEHPKLARHVAQAIIDSGYQGGARREYTRVLMRRLVQLSGIIQLDDSDEAHLTAAIAQIRDDARATLEAQAGR